MQYLQSRSPTSRLRSSFYARQYNGLSAIWKRMHETLEGCPFRCRNHRGLHLSPALASRLQLALLMHGENARCWWERWPLSALSN